MRFRFRKLRGTLQIYTSRIFHRPRRNRTIPTTAEIV
jgi:hypothetical protein